MRRVALTLGVLLAAVGLATPCLAVDEVSHQTYPLSPGGSFQLQNVNGSVEVTGWERNEVEVHAVKSARRDPRDLEKVRIVVDARPESVAVETRYPEEKGVEVAVEYRIRVPRRVLLSRVGTVNGRVRVSGLEATGQLRSVNGDVEAFDIAGRLDARTTNGNIRLELRQFDSAGSMALETVNGSVVLSLPTDAEAELDIRSVNGEFRSELPVTLQGALGDREFRGRLGAGGSAIRIRTVNGGIRVVTSRPTV